MKIEVEVRSFISEKKYNELLSFFSKEGKFLGEDFQQTFYFDCEEDLRIQRNSRFSKIWLKKGRLHDEVREEIEIKFPREDFEKLEELLVALGFNVSVKWFRTRHTFFWEGVHVMLDYTKGYGYIIELEKEATEENKHEALELLKGKMQVLCIPIAPKEEFERKYNYYKENWKQILRISK